jgi:hypothetical protein
MEERVTTERMMLTLVLLAGLVTLLVLGRVENRIQSIEQAVREAQ